MQKTVSTKLYRWLFELAEGQGYDRRVMSRVVGIDDRLLDVPEGRIDGDSHVRMVKLTASWPLACESLESDIAGRLLLFPELAGVVCNCHTLREALRQLVKYRDLVGNVDWVLIRETNDRMAFDYVLEGEGRTTISALRSFLTLVGVARLYDPAFRISEMQASGAPPDGYAKWDEALGTRIDYYQSRNRLVLVSNALDRPFERYNEVLAGIHLRAASELREQIRHNGSFSTTIAHKLRDCLHDGSDDLSAASLQQRLCDELGISRWTMLRRLRAEDTQFQDLLLQARMGEARALLLHTRLPISEIADRMHFGSVSAFSRFFTRTSGVAPSRFRADRQYGASNNEGQ